jgi:hypothetical protein
MKAITYATIMAFLGAAAAQPYGGKLNGPDLKETEAQPRWYSAFPNRVEKRDVQAYGIYANNPGQYPPQAAPALVAS